MFGTCAVRKLLNYSQHKFGSSEDPTGDYKRRRQVHSSQPYSSRFTLLLRASVFPIMLRLLSLTALLCLVAYTSGQEGWFLWTSSTHVVFAWVGSLPAPPPESEVEAFAVEAEAVPSRTSPMTSLTTLRTRPTRRVPGRFCPTHYRLFWCPTGNVIASYSGGSFGWCCWRCSDVVQCYAWTYVPDSELCILWGRCRIRLYNAWGAIGNYRWIRNWGAL